MNKGKAILAFLLIFALFATMFAACSKSDGSQTPAPDQSGNTPSTPDANTGKETPSDAHDEEVVEVNFFLLDELMKAEYSDHMLELLNAYLEENYHLRVNLSQFDTASWVAKVQLAISGGEPVDLMTLCVRNGLQVMYSANMLMDITDYAAEYAPQTLEVMADYIDSYKFGGRLYGIPTNRPLCTNRYIVMRKDVLDDLGLTDKARNMSSWSEYEEIMQAVTDNYTGTGMYALTRGNGYSTLPDYLFSGDSWDTIELYDTLGDQFFQIYADNDGHVSWILDDPRYESKLQMVAVWAEKGFIWPDSAFADDQGHDLMKSKISFSYLVPSEYGVETAKGKQSDCEVICPMYAGAIIATSGLAAWGVGVPVTAQEPEAACRLLDVLYTDEYVMNLLVRGVKDEDYTLDSDGCVVYPTGDTAYYRQMDWLVGNNLLLTPMSGNGADYYEVCQRLNEEAMKSPYLGFVFDTADLDLVVSQVSAVYNTFYPDLFTGSYTPDRYQEYKDKLTAAGIDEYVGAYQAQLDAWMAAN